MNNAFYIKMENKKQKEKVEMSIRGTIIGEITKKAKINWDNMSEKEADEEIEKKSFFLSIWYAIKGFFSFVIGG